MVSKNLSVCLSVEKFDLNYLRTGEIELAEIFLGYLCHKMLSQNCFTKMENYATDLTLSFGFCSQ